MYIDEGSNFWVAEWGGFCVSKWKTFTRENIEKVEIPSENVTSVCFDDHKNLYVTTARSIAQGEEKGGALFYIKNKKGCIRTNHGSV